MFNKISTQAKDLVSLTQARNNNSHSKTKVIAITSGKGGVGKSTITANMAYLLSQEGNNVIVLDADIGLANMQVLFDIHPKYSFLDYINGTIQLENTLIPTKYKNISLCAGKSGYEHTKNINSLVVSRVVQDIIQLNKYDILLIDTGAGINDYVQEFLSIAHKILAVTTTDPSAITDLYALIKMLSKSRKKLYVCFNHTKDYQIGERMVSSIIQLAQKNNLNRAFIIEYIGNIIDTQKIQTTSRLRKLFTKEFGNEKATSNIKEILSNLINT